MNGAVMRSGKPLKGRTVIGYAPVTGQPRDAQGRLILDWIYETRAGAAAAGKSSPRVATSDLPAQAQPDLF